jgi:hypothetical protein
MSNFVNSTPYLRSTREFPENIKDIAFQCNKAYLETANAINQRTIGIFPIIKSAITGESWFINKNRKQQSLRQVFTFGSITHALSPFSIPYKLHGFDQFVRIWGTCTTVLPDYRPIPYSSVTANANIEVNVTPTNIVITLGAASPELASGLIVLEWLSQSWYSLDI